MIPTPELKEFLSYIRDAPAPVLATLDNKDFMPCACGKKVRTDSMPVFDTGCVKAIDNVCIGCTKDYAGLSKLVCGKCRTLVGRVTPHKDKLGFEFKKDQTYHIAACFLCCPGLEKSEILEKIIYYRKNNIKYTI